MQKGSAQRWGCPFLQGKIIGLFTHAFKRPCWADETLNEDPENPYLDLHIYPSNRELASELEGQGAQMSGAVLQEVLGGERGVVMWREGG